MHTRHVKLLVPQAGGGTVSGTIGIGAACFRGMRLRITPGSATINFITKDIYRTLDSHTGAADKYYHDLQEDGEMLVNGDVIVEASNASAPNTTIDAELFFHRFP